MSPELAAKLESARTFVVDVLPDGVAITLRRPTVDAWRLWCVEHGARSGVDETAWERLTSEKLPGCIVGWRGVTLRHFGGESDELVPHSPETAALLVQDVAWARVAIFRGIVDRINAQIERVEAAAGNSARASSTA